MNKPKIAFSLLILGLPSATRMLKVSTFPTEMAKTLLAQQDTQASALTKE
jgi:hypothetical protein